MKSVLISIQPYWVFLIIAKTMGWNINKDKTVEIRKNYPKDENWNKVTKIYCSKDKKSFAKIPNEYQPLMKQFLGKVIGEFVCDYIGYVRNYGDMVDSYDCKASCLSANEIIEYAKDKNGNFIYTYGWHISDLVIYDKPRELNRFQKPCIRDYCDCAGCENAYFTHNYGFEGCALEEGLTRPPQSWCYVESEVEGE